MTARRIIVYGNAGSGKTTMARAVAREFGLPHLGLDDVTWAASGERMPVADSLAALNAFVAANPDWVIDGCYGDLIEAVVPHATELRFLNPGVEVCVANCRNRPWEPGYCESPEEQQRLLGPLIDFVRGYDTRTDEYSLARHRAIFAAFPGPKYEYTFLPAL